MCKHPRRFIPGDSSQEFLKYRTILSGTNNQIIEITPPILWCLLWPLTEARATATVIWICGYTWNNLPSCEWRIALNFNNMWGCIIDGTIIQFVVARRGGAVPCNDCRRSLWQGMKVLPQISHLITVLTDMGYGDVSPLSCVFHYTYTSLMLLIICLKYGLPCKTSNANAWKGIWIERRI